MNVFRSAPLCLLILTAACTNTRQESAPLVAQSSSPDVRLDGRRFHAIQVTREEPNYFDSNTGQSYYCPAAARSPADCAFVEPQANFKDTETDRSYFCPDGATTLSQCLWIKD